MIIEAKRGKEDLINVDNEMEIMYYASGVSVPLAILTNGKSWQFYLPLLGGGFERKRFFTVDISKSDPESIASKFIELLSKDNVKNIDLINYEELIYDKYKTHIKTVEEIKPIKPPDSRLQYYLSTNNDFTGMSIYSFYFNGTEYQAEKWKDLLTGILDIIYIERRNFEKILGITGKQGRIYFSRDPNEINKPLEIKSTGIYVDTKLSSNNIVRLCCDIMYEFGYSEDDLKIKTSKSNDINPNKIEEKIDLKPVKEDIKLQQLNEDLKPVKENINLKPKKEKYIESNIKQNISSAGDKDIKFKFNDIVNALGDDFKDLNPTSIYWGLKYVLFKEGIVVGTESWKSEEKMLTMRKATPTDVLPPSLADNDDKKEEEKRSEEFDNLELLQEKKYKLCESMFALDEQIKTASNEIIAREVLEKKVRTQEEIDSLIKQIKKLKTNSLETSSIEIGNLNIQEKKGKSNTK